MDFQDQRASGHRLLLKMRKAPARGAFVCLADREVSARFRRRRGWARNPPVRMRSEWWVRAAQRRSGREPLSAALTHPPALTHRGTKNPGAVSPPGPLREFQFHE